MTKLNRENIVLVLVEPKTAGNIGSIARAMNNMGFEHLRLVNPQTNHLDDHAYRLAHASGQFLEKAEVFPTIEEAVADCTLTVATCHRAVRNGQVTFSPREMGPALVPYCEKNKVAIIFGRENHGLSNEEVNNCPWILSIPAARVYPSLNLAQSAMLICYELFMVDGSVGDPVPELVTNEQMEKFYEKTLEIIDIAGFPHKNDKSDIYMGSIRRIFGRTGLDDRELRVLYKLFDQFKKIAEKSGV